EGGDGAEEGGEEEGGVRGLAVVELSQAREEQREDDGEPRVLGQQLGSSRGGPWRRRCRRRLRFERLAAHRIIPPRGSFVPVSIGSTRRAARRFGNCRRRAGTPDGRCSASSPPPTRSSGARGAGGSRSRGRSCRRAGPRRR